MSIGYYNVTTNVMRISFDVVVREDERGGCAQSADI